MLDNVSFGDIAVVLVLIILSVSLHELMHALVAYRLGDDLAYHRGRISLNPIRHIDPFLTVLLPLIMLVLGQPPILAAKPVPINMNRVSGGENGLALIGIAGPLTNLFLAILIAGVLRTIGDVGTISNVLITAFQINIGLFAFNMLPIPPIDGSRLLYAFAPQKMKEVMERIEGLGILPILIFLSLLYPFIVPLLRSVQDGLTTFLLG